MSGAAYIYGAVRTPFGRYGGALAKTRPDDLAAGALRALLDRAPGLDPAAIDDVILGNANGAGEDNRDVARMAVLLAGLPTSVPGATVNRLCGSSLEASIQAARAIETGDAEVMVAGGVESMSRAPWVMPKPERAFPAGHETLWSTTLGWRMVNPAMPGEWTISLGESAEKLADIYEISREAQDEFALRSHTLADAAWDEGRFPEVVPVPGVDARARRGDPRRLLPGEARQAEARLRRGRHGHRRQLLAAERRRLDAAARLRGRGATRSAARRSPASSRAASTGSTPTSSGSRRSRPPTRRSRKAGLTWDDIDAVELNEAFASQSLACLKGWPDLDPAKVNMSGGAIAIGHPLGASGARVVGRAVTELRARGGRYGLATLCIGVGQGLAMVVEAEG